MKTAQWFCLILAGIVVSYNVIQAAPVLLSQLPEHGATEVPVNAMLTLEFDQPVTVGPGEIQVVRSNGMQSLIPAEDFLIEGSRASFPLHRLWIRWGYPYTVSIDNDCFHDGEYNYFDGDSVDPWVFSVSSTPFSLAGSAFTGVSDGDIAWCDYDMDGDMDVLLCGNSSSGPVTLLYQNEAGVFTAVDSGLIGVEQSSAEWGDYDNDGDPDLLLTGRTADLTKITRIYRNEDGFFVDAEHELHGIQGGNATWGDYDRDGDLDIALSGEADDYAYPGIGKIYRNDEGLFVQVSMHSLFAALDGEVCWIEHGEDGFLDCLAIGYSTYYNSRVSLLSEYHSYWFETYSAYDIPHLSNSSMDLADFDGDGDLDIILTGALSESANLNCIALNTGSGFDQHLISWNHMLHQVQGGTGCWVDLNQDGALDILLTGTTFPNQGDPCTSLWETVGGSIYTNEVTNDLLDLHASCAAFGDFDGDNDLDLLLTGRDDASVQHSALYLANLVPNLPPIAPVNLQTNYNGSDLVLSWNAGSDDLTNPEALSYSCYLTDTPGGTNLLSPMADTATGWRYAPVLGNVGQGTGHTLHLDLPDGFYYWSVQSVDANHLGSAFALEQSFMVGTPVLDAPQNLLITVADEQAALSWDPMEIGISIEYIIYTSEEPHAVFPEGWQVAGPPTVEPTWLDPVPAEAGDKKFYRVKAVVVD